MVSLSITHRFELILLVDLQVCRYFLVRFCPHDLFHNTKADLGPCPNLHDEALRSRYQEEAALHTRIKFEDEFLKVFGRVQLVWVLLVLLGLTLSRLAETTTYES